MAYGRQPLSANKHAVAIRKLYEQRNHRLSLISSLTINQLESFWNDYRATKLAREAKKFIVGIFNPNKVDISWYAYNNAKLANTDQERARIIMEYMLDKEHWHLSFCEFLWENLTVVKLKDSVTDSPVKVDHFIDTRLEDLPTELVTCLSNNYLDDRSVMSWSAVSKHFNSLFKANTYWVARIFDEFRVEPECFLYVGKLIKNIDYSGVYKKLRKLMRSISHASKEIKFFCEDSENLSSILMCCADCPESFLSIMDPVEIYLWLEIALLAGCIEIPKSIYGNLLNLTTSRLKYLASVTPLSKNDQEQIAMASESMNLLLIMVTTSANRLDMIKHLFDKTNQFQLEIIATYLVLAAQYGRDDMIDFYLNSNNSLKSIIATPITMLWGEKVLIIDAAAKGGHLSSIEKLISYGAIANDKTFELAERVAEGADGQSYYKRPIHNESDLLINMARAGDFDQLYNNLVDSSYEAAVYKKLLFNAGQTGHLPMIKFLIERAKPAGIVPDHSTLAVAAISNNLALVRYLLLPGNRFHIDVNEAAFEDSKSMTITSIIAAHAHLNIVLAILRNETNQEEFVKMKASFHKMGLDDMVGVLLTSALSWSLVHTGARLVDILKDPAFYCLSDDAVKTLHDYTLVLTRDGLNSLINRHPRLALMCVHEYINEVFLENWEKNFAREMGEISVANKCRI